MQGSHSRIAREGTTVEAMIRLYCQNMHKSGEELCPDCSSLLGYALNRLDRCPYQERKTTCARCPTHCYWPGMRDATRRVMRYSGPRMLVSHPILAVLHLMDGFRKEPIRTRREAKG